MGGKSKSNEWDVDAICLNLTVTELLGLWAALEDFVSPDDIENAMNKTNSTGELFKGYISIKNKVDRLATIINKSLLEACAKKEMEDDAPPSHN